jgi:hypothetical protein
VKHRGRLSSVGGSRIGSGDPRTRQFVIATSTFRDI